MAKAPRLIIQLASGSAVQRQLSEAAPRSVASGEAVVITGEADAMGHLEAPAGGRPCSRIVAPTALATNGSRARSQGAGTPCGL